MKLFTVYDPSTGQINGAGNGPELLENSVEGLYSSEEFYIDPATKTPVVFNKPGRYHKWSWLTHSWSEDLESAISTTKTKIDDLREIKIYEKILYNGSYFDADEKAIRNIGNWQIQLAAGASVPRNFVWRDADNIDHPADASFINGLGEAITLRGSLFYQVAWQHKANIEQLTTVAEIEAYDINIGW